jgi:thiol-disulfide isomerase/thioredoxin
MSKTGIIVALIVLVAIIGGGIYYTSQNDTSGTNEDAMKNSAMMEKDGDAMEGDAMMEKDGDAMEGEAMEKEETQASTGTYKAYSASAVNSAPANATTIIFFHASWCPTCRSLDANINASAETIPAGYTILKADYDAETELRKKYGVTTQHTLVQIDADGNLVKKWTGSATLSSILGQVS